MQGLYTVSGLPHYLLGTLISTFYMSMTLGVKTLCNGWPLSNPNKNGLTSNMLPSPSGIAPELLYDAHP